jgi:hypothetical protein
MTNHKPYRLYALEIMSLARNVTNPELATRYRTLAQSFMALARFQERAERYRVRAWDCGPAADAPGH